METDMCINRTERPFRVKLRRNYISGSCLIGIDLHVEYTVFARSKEEAYGRATGKFKAVGTRAAYYIDQPWLTPTEECRS